MLTIGKCLSDIRLRRCGVIPYLLLRDQLWFLLARHRKTAEVGDLGGGIKKIETPLEGGIREFHEESRGIFLEVYRSPADMAACVTLVDPSDMAEIFVPVDPQWFSDAWDRFQEAGDVPRSARTSRSSLGESKDLSLIDSNVIKRSPLGDEMSEVIWVSEDIMNQLVWGSSITKLPTGVGMTGDDLGLEDPWEPVDLIMWKRIRLFLQKSLRSREKFYQYLKNHALLFSVTHRLPPISSLLSPAGV
jgi:hypothetical protein